MSSPGKLPGMVTVLDSPEAMAGAAADWVLEAAADAAAASGRFRIALAGGSTPRRLYQLLAASPRRERAQWSRWEVYFGDERAVPPEDPSSNYRMAREALLDQVAVPPAAIHRMEAERVDLEAAAAEYSSMLAATCPPIGTEDVPRLDAVLLGLGENGHTASLFPGEPVLEVTDRWAARARADYAPFDRITLTLPVLDAAARVAFLVAGAGKGEALRGVIAGSVPAARVRPIQGELRWFLDSAAAGAV